MRIPILHIVSTHDVVSLTDTSCILTCVSVDYAYEGVHICLVAYMLVLCMLCHVFDVIFDDHDICPYSRHVASPYVACFCYNHLCCISLSVYESYALTGTTWVF